MKKLVSRDETQKKIVEGIDEMGKIVGSTLGGRGKNIALSNGNDVQIVNDGVTIAREVSFDHDPVKNIGAALAKKVAEKTNEEAGDGTTTSIVLFQEYVKALGQKKVSDPRQLRDDVRKVLSHVIGKLDEMKTAVTTNEEIRRVAFISSLDERMADTIAEVVEKTGKDGVITISPKASPGIEIEYVHGVRVSEGYVVREMITHHDQGVAKLEETPVLVTKKSISSITDITPVLENLIAKDIKRLAIFTEEISDEVLGFLIMNKVAGLFNALVVRTHDIEDIATATGAKLITNENNLKFEDSNLGVAKEVKAERNQTTVVGKDEVSAAIVAEIETLKKLLENTIDEYEAGKVRRRIARLEGGVAIIRVAGENDQETREMRLKLEDALNAARAAIEDGIIAGGGITLWAIAESMKKGNLSDAEDLMIDVMQAPMRRIIENAEEEYDKIITGILNHDFNLKNEELVGYNVVSRKYEVFMKTGVIDPVKVTKAALTNAINMGNMVVTTDGSVVFTMEAPKN